MSRGIIYEGDNKYTSDKEPAEGRLYVARGNGLRASLLSLFKNTHA